MKWSKYQTDIYDAFEHSQDSLLIEAVAGSGKTTCLVELARIMREKMPGLRGCFLAFNKSIAMTLQERIGSGGNVVAMTLHSAGWMAWRRAGGLDWTPRLEQHKVSGIIKGMMTWEERKRWEETTRKLVSYAKGMGIVPGDSDMGVEIGGMRLQGLEDDDQETWDGLIEHYGLDPDECSIEWARKVLARSIETMQEQCDYDDMLYAPVIAGVPFERYDVVLVDEAQDVSGIQMEMISRMTAREHAGGPDRPDTPPVFLLEQNHPKYRPRPRVIAVGDRNQAIYGFRGAGTDSMDLMKQRFGMRELPLSVSYRCPVSVVQHARQWVPQIEWREDAEDGIVFMEDHNHRLQAEITLDGITKWKGISDFQAGDAILCRLTRPLIEAAFALIRKRVACRVLGRDIGAGLVALVKKPKFAPDRPVSDWERWAAVWFEREAAKLREKKQFAALGNLEDRLTTVGVFIEELSSRREVFQEGDTAGSIRSPEPAIGELIASIESAFRERGPEGLVTLGTIHKMKGLEFDRVFVLDASKYMPVPWGRGGGWESVQEVNCMYIAATRASRELRYIRSEDLGIERRR